MHAFGYRCPVVHGIIQDSRALDSLLKRSGNPADSGELFTLPSVLRLFTSLSNSGFQKENTYGISDVLLFKLLKGFALCFLHFCKTLAGVYYKIVLNCPKIYPRYP
jgi:hypothetical protein